VTDSTDNLIKAVDDFLGSLPPNQHVLVAYSGGVDSTVLLHLLWRLNPHYRFELGAIHVHHGLNEAADDWVRHCQKICLDWSIPLKINYIRDKVGKGESIEAWARERRRAIFKANLDRADKWIVTAQHQNDQAETLLLQLFRGSGGRGLAAMPARKAMAAGYLARPLLAVPRHDIMQYAQRHELRWVEDSSNQHMNFDRNYLRQQIWPLISQRWPSAAVTLGRSAELLARQNRVLDGYCEQLLDSVSDAGGSRLLLAELSAMNEDTQLLLLRYWLRQRGVRVPGSRRLRAGLAMLLGAGDSANPCLEWANAKLARYRQHLYLLQGQHPLPTAMEITPGQTLSIAGLGQFRLEPGFPGFVLSEPHLLQVRFRRGGERLALQRGGPHRELKKLLQEWGVAPWLRQRLPLLYRGDQLLAVADLAIAAEFQAPHSDNSYVLRRLPLN